MPYNSKEKRREWMRKFRQNNRDIYNEHQRKFQKSWRDKNKQRVRKYNHDKLKNGVALKYRRRSILLLSDAYVNYVANRQIGKSIATKRIEILIFRIKKLLKLLYEKQNRGFAESSFRAIGKTK